MIRPTLAIMFATALVLLTGCRGGSVVPEGWTEVRIDSAPIEAQLAASTAWPAEDESARDGDPRVQVFVHYSRQVSTHTALRVTAPGALPVFWDPGGNYGTTNPEYGRRNDVILTQPPDTRTWWAYRYQWLNEPFLYIFEWDLEAEQAHVMREVLLEGAAMGRSAEEFQTVRRPGFCNFAVTDFLQSYASPPIGTELRNALLPDALARQLWGLSPDRVLRYEGQADALPVVLLPPAADSLSPTSDIRSVRSDLR